MEAEVAIFSEVGELESAARDTGWDIDYRQLRRGGFASWWASCEIDGICLATEELDNRLQICCEPPPGFMGIMIPRFPAGEAGALGNDIQLGDLVVFPCGSELELLTRGRMQSFTLFLPEEDFLAAVRSVAPGVHLFTPRSATVLRGNPGQVTALQRQMDSLFESGGQDAEIASNMLASTILWLVDTVPHGGDGRIDRERELNIARRARDYIDENFRETIRLQELCACTGIGLRTLQRCFAQHYQISPTEYIKVRRLNAVRRELLSFNPQQCRVTDIAIRNGLPHLGRFSAEYQRFFGELPSQTLKKQGSPIIPARVLYPRSRSVHT